MLESAFLLWTETLLVGWFISLPRLLGFKVTCQLLPKISRAATLQAGVKNPGLFSIVKQDACRAVCCWDKWQRADQGVCLKQRFLRSPFKVPSLTALHCFLEECLRRCKLKEGEHSLSPKALRTGTVVPPNCKPREGWWMRDRKTIVSVRSMHHILEVSTGYVCMGYINMHVLII